VIGFSEWHRTVFFCASQSTLNRACSPLDQMQDLVVF